MPVRFHIRIFNRKGYIIKRNISSVNIVNCLCVLFCCHSDFYFHLFVSFALLYRKILDDYSKNSSTPASPKKKRPPHYKKTAIIHFRACPSASLTFRIRSGYPQFRANRAPFLRSLTTRFGTALSGCCYYPSRSYTRTQRLRLPKYQQIYLATGNLNKKREISQVLPDFEVVIPKEMGINFDPEETGTDFYQNSIDIARRDYNSTMEHYQEMGLEKGLKQGIQQGIRSRPSINRQKKRRPPLLGRPPEVSQQSPRGQIRDGDDSYDSG